MKTKTLKDFKAGDVAFLIIECKGHTNQRPIQEVKVKSVGRKYVTIDNGWETKFKEDDAEYLVNDEHYGEWIYLFNTKKEAEAYIEKREIALWLGRLSISRAKEYSVEQLRKVWAILNESADACNGSGKKIWARVGMSVILSDEDHEDLCSLMKENPGEAEAVLNRLFKEEGFVDGESYLPADCEDNPNGEEFAF